MYAKISTGSNPSLPHVAKAEIDELNDVTKKIKSN